jgi:hypothetical protein
MIIRAGHGFDSLHCQRLLHIASTVEPLLFRTHKNETIIDLVAFPS